MGFLFMLPAAAVLLVFLTYPLGLGIWLGLTDVKVGRPGIFVISVGDVELLPHVLNAAERFERATADDDMDALVQRLQMEPLFV